MIATALILLSGTISGADQAQALLPLAIDLVGRLGKSPADTADLS
jgi:hypothetical protein